MIRNAALLIVFLLSGAVFCERACATESPESDGRTVKITANGKSVVGKVVEATSRQVIILRRDGRLLEFRDYEIESLKKLSGGFTPYSSLKLQDHYRKMFGNRYEVTRTRHYVVVHPRGLRSQWADPFDQLYNRFNQYFSVRGYTQRNAEFPMVVVVFGTRGEFNKVAMKDGISNPNAYAGYYSSTSNWIITWKDSSHSVGGNWENNETLIHEALHQYAFNRGIHQRWAPTPKWCAEGLAAMFEARGVNNATRHRNLKDRINASYAGMLKQAVNSPDFMGNLQQLVASDRLFDENISLSYSLSWGLAFYLAETRPHDFNTYLQRIAARDRLAPYSSSDRIADFARSFGSDFALLESHLKNFVNDLR